MARRFDVKARLEEVSIQLPIRGFSALSHVDNIEFCMRQLESASRHFEEPVIGYVVEQALGTRHILHRILPRKQADLLKERSPRFDYVGFTELQKRRDEIARGKYVLYNGLIVGLNPAYDE